jgi:hypothetical protein
MERKKKLLQTAGRKGVLSAILLASAASAILNDTAC